MSTNLLSRGPHRKSMSYIPPQVTTSTGPKQDSSLRSNNTTATETSRTPPIFNPPISLAQEVINRHSIDSDVRSEVFSDGGSQSTAPTTPSSNISDLPPDRGIPPKRTLHLDNPRRIVPPGSIPPGSIPPGSIPVMPPLPNSVEIEVEVHISRAEKRKAVFSASDLPAAGHSRSVAFRRTPFINASLNVENPKYRDVMYCMRIKDNEEIVPMGIDLGSNWTWIFSVESRNANREPIGVLRFGDKFEVSVDAVVLKRLQFDLTDTSTFRHAVTQLPVSVEVGVVVTPTQDHTVFPDPFRSSRPHGQIGVGASGTVYYSGFGTEQTLLKRMYLDPTFGPILNSTGEQGIGHLTLHLRRLFGYLKFGGQLPDRIEWFRSTAPLGLWGMQLGTRITIGGALVWQDHLQLIVDSGQTFTTGPKTLIERIYINSGIRWRRAWIKRSLFYFTELAIPTDETIITLSQTTRIRLPPAFWYSAVTYYINGVQWRFGPFQPEKQLDCFTFGVNMLEHITVHLKLDIARDKFYIGFIQD